MYVLMCASHLVLSYVAFFFQAEDGIRDGHVTGVQTCALPISAVIPYFGYARQDRKDKPRVPISAKLMANILEAAGANRIMTMDFHADQIQGFFDIPVDHLRSEAIFMPYLENFDLSDVIFASPDVGDRKSTRLNSSEERRVGKQDARRA